MANKVQQAGGQLSTFGLAMSGQKKAEKKTPKKQLNYNAREISNQLRRTNKVRTTSEVLVRARGKVATLQRCLYTGQYDEGEVRVALIHARKMVYCAQVKVRNLKEEEQQKKRDQKRSVKDREQAKEQKKAKAKKEKQAIRFEMAEKERELQQKETRRAIERNRIRRIHRDDERIKINKADMEYDGNKRGNSNLDISMAAYEYELSEAARQMQELQRQSLELEMQENMAENTPEMSVTVGGTIDVSIAGDVTMAVDGAEAGDAVDVCV